MPDEYIVTIKGLVSLKGDLEQHTRLEARDLFLSQALLAIIERLEAINTTLSHIGKSPEG